MSKGRMREVETWHGYVETLSSWLALQDESFVRELQLCVKVKHEILQKDLSVEVAARSAKLFYYLTQALAKWERGSFSVFFFFFFWGGGGWFGVWGLGLCFPGHVAPMIRRLGSLEQLVRKAIAPQNMPVVLR